MFADYQLGAAWDEMLSLEGEPRQSYRAVHHTLRSMRPEQLKERAESLARIYLDQGVTFDHAGEERPFPLDAVPRVISAEEWAPVEAGVVQRVRVLEALLDDVYGSSGQPRAVRDGKIPFELIASSSHFHRAVAGIRPANGVRVHVAGVDLIRDENGVFRVLEDNVRVPSGVSYVMANRRAMTNVFPESFSSLPIRPVHEYPLMLLNALRAAAPDSNPDPTVVVLTPGVYNSAYFEHTLLARSMGVELVEGRDLTCSGGVVRMHTTQGEQQVDVIYRRVDDEFLDPVHFRGDSMLGCAGLVTALRAGHVGVANAIGNGVADDKLIYSYIPELVRYYLDEEPILPNVDTYRCNEPAALAMVLDHLDEMVVKPVDGSGGKGLVIGPKADGPTLDRLREALVADPRAWIAQPVVQLSTVPTLIDGSLRPRHVDLRPFSVNDGDTIRVIPGGLTRVALPEGQLIVNSSQGGGSKDTWVLSDRAQRRAEARREAIATSRAIAMGAVASAPPVDFSSQQQQQQQQQQQRNQQQHQQHPPQPSAQRHDEQAQTASSSAPQAPDLHGQSAPSSAPQAQGGARC